MRRLLVGVVLGVLTLGACGGGSGDSAGSANSTLAGGGGTIGSTAANGDAPAAFCEAQGETGDLSSLMSQLSTLNTSDALNEAENNFKKALAAAPAEIRPDMQTIFDAFLPVIQALRTSTNFATINPAVFQRMQAADVTAAMQRVSTYFGQYCD